jgi:MFS transporter, DHA2 family, multidrug resistance protein
MSTVVSRGSLSGRATLVGGLVVLAVFYVWERRLNRQPGGQPLIDLSLFHSASFSWGAVLAAFAVLARIGVLLTMPQYVQGVLGTNAMGSGLLLQPVIGGLVLGAVPADRIVNRVGAKLTTASGFVLLAVGLSIGAATGVGSSVAFVAIWMGIVGLGMGLALATATSAALMELSEERSGVGSAVLQAINKLGGPFGTAILGSVLTMLYLSRLTLSGLAALAVAAVRQSVFGGVAVAEKLGSTALLHSVRGAFVAGMDAALLVSAGIAVVGLILTLLFLPSTNAAKGIAPVAADRHSQAVGARV